MEDNYVEMVDALKQDCDRMGKDFVRSLRERTGKQLDVTGIPIALAAIFDELIESKVDTDSFYLKETVQQLIGMRLERYAPGIEALAAKLHEIGATSADNKVNNGGDNYMYSISRTYFWRYVLVFETQNRIGIILMRYGREAVNNPDEIKKRLLTANPQMSEKDIEEFMSYYRPQIYIIQQPRSEELAALERYAQLNNAQLPDWTDDRTPHGYVAFLKDGEVDGAIHHYGKICYCLYNLASFIECRDELELD